MAGMINGIRNAEKSLKLFFFCFPQELVDAFKSKLVELDPPEPQDMVEEIVDLELSKGAQSSNGAPFLKDNSKQGSAHLQKSSLSSEEPRGKHAAWSSGQSTLKQDKVMRRAAKAADWEEKYRQALEHQQQAIKLQQQVIELLQEQMADKAVTSSPSTQSSQSAQLAAMETDVFRSKSG